MPRALIIAISAVLLVVSLFGAFVEVRAARLGIPGQHRLVVIADILIAIYAAAALVIRLRQRGGERRG
jgi:hypothetical protein